MTIKELKEMLECMDEDTEVDEYELHRMMNEEEQYKAERLAEIEWRSMESAWQQDIIDMYRRER